MKRSNYDNTTEIKKQKKFLGPEVNEQVILKTKGWA